MNEYPSKDCKLCRAMAESACPCGPSCPCGPDCGCPSGCHGADRRNDAELAQWA